jgi:putative addiction module component (TIGR02574 family)
MSMTQKEVFEQALHLDERERAALASLLIESLEMEVEEGVEAAWLAEIERRVAELDSGAARAVPWEEVKARLLANLDAPPKR